jgi:hypothetical protein
MEKWNFHDQFHTFHSQVDTHKAHFIYTSSPIACVCCLCIIHT